MAIRITVNFAIFFLVLSVGPPTWAQQAGSEDCTLYPEAIENLLEPTLGTYSLWDLINGTTGMAESFEDFLMRGKDEVVLGGFQKNDELRRPLLQKMNRRGRTLWSWRDKNERGHSRPIEIKKLIDRGQSFLTIGQVYEGDTPHAIWIARFDYQGRKGFERMISETERNLLYGGITEAADGQGWIMAVTETRQSEGNLISMPYSRFIKLNGNFVRRGTHSFIPGPYNKVYDIATFKEEKGEPYFIAVGEIDDGYGRPAGLVVRLDKNANVVWQKTYPRGKGLRWHRVRQAGEGAFIVLGEVRPITEKAPEAGVVMQLQSSNGKEIWQRYFRYDGINYQGRDLVVKEDGRTYILLNGTLKETSEIMQDHARIFILSPRGETLSEISYTTGLSGSGRRLKQNVEGQITLSGQAVMKDPDPEDPQNSFIKTKKGWFLVGEKIDNYTDPCLVQEQDF